MRRRRSHVDSHPSPRPSVRAARRLAIGVLFLLTSVFTLAVPVATLAWSSGDVQLHVRVGPRRDDQSEPGRAPGSRRSRSTRPSLGRPLAEQGHDRPGLLQPLDPGLREGLGQAQRDRLLLQRRRREHRLEQLSRRHRHRRHPAGLHELVRPSGEHHGQGLGRHRHRRLQGPDRQEDVDGPVRRQVRLDRPEADAQAHDPGRRPTPRPTPKPAPKATPRPTPKPAPAATPQLTPAPTPRARPRVHGRRCRATTSSSPRAAATGRVRRGAVRTDLDPAWRSSSRPSGCGWSIGRARTDCSEPSSAEWPASSSEVDHDRRHAHPAPRLARIRSRRS